MIGTWTLVEQSGPAGDLHAASAATLAAEGVGRQVRVLRATSRALVLGSSQPETMVDPAALGRSGVALARRRSGGSAVLVGPAEVLWVDLVVPAGDPLWDDDVNRATWWVGDVWAAALARAGIPGSEVWKGPMRRTPWSKAVCFAGVGPGEVLVGGRKVVGISQRRSNRAALLQTAALLRWEPGDYLDLLGAAPAGPAAPEETDPVELETAAAGIGPAREETVLAALLEQLTCSVP